MIMSRYRNIGVYFAIWAFTWYLVSVLKTYSKKQKTKNKTQIFFFLGSSQHECLSTRPNKKVKEKI